MAADDLIIRLENISYAYPGRDPVLKGLDLSFRRGDRIGLLGPNGSGKTTLFHLIMGLLKPSAGRVVIFGEERRDEKDFIAVRRRIGLLFQDPDDQLFSPTVLEDVAFGPLNLGKTRDEAASIAHDTLNFLGLQDFAGRITHKLSGGEKRLVSLATVLSMSPEVLLLDEPTNGLDAGTRTRLIDILSRLNLSYLVISHDGEFLEEITKGVFLMEDGKILQEDALHLHKHIHAHPLGAYPHEHK